MSSAPAGGLIDVDRASPRTIRLIVRPGLAPGDMRPLADRLVRELRRGEVAEVLVDVSRVRSPDIGYVDALARLQLGARRHGSRVRLVSPCPRLLELLALVGLDELLPADGGWSGDLHREAEQGEEPVDVEVGVDTGDPVA
ncbi:MAG TPA: STAS domain-containing protein [Jiangellaceae bacterium]